MKESHTVNIDNYYAQVNRISHNRIDFYLHVLAMPFQNSSYGYLSYLTHYQVVSRI